MVTTIQVDENVKAMLDKLKVHHRESYNELLLRMAEGFSDADKESLVATLEVLSSPETMRNIAEGLEAYERGEGKTLKEVKKELRL
ncbi:hypothetical protein CMI48_01230 [Candidatus Pacearchaeota archaeon]|nr:hypothetical protein [Candidatus Pacearchaeota archaeon]